MRLPQWLRNPFQPARVAERHETTPAQFPIRWTMLRDVGNSRVLRTSYFWLLFVPFAARALGGVKENLVLRMFSEVFHVTFDLPFNWGVFYFAAVCFSIGGIIYSLRCPEIVKRYSAFPGFVAEGRGVRYLRSVATTYRLGSGDSAAVKALLDEYEFVPGAVVGTKTVRNPEDRDPEKLADAFWIVHRAANHMDRTSLVSCLAFYAGGFLLLGYVMLENFWYVFRLTVWS